jgi:hypothetical protein
MDFILQFINFIKDIVKTIQDFIKKARGEEVEEEA